MEDLLSVTLDGVARTTPAATAGTFISVLQVGEKVKEASLVRTMSGFPYAWWTVVRIIRVANRFCAVLLVGTAPVISGVLAVCIPVARRQVLVRSTVPVAR
jgi:hypothetical protein